MRTNDPMHYIACQGQHTHCLGYPAWTEPRCLISAWCFNIVPWFQRQSARNLCHICLNDQWTCRPLSFVFLVLLLCAKLTQNYLSYNPQVHLLPLAKTLSISQISSHSIRPTSSQLSGQQTQVPADRQSGGDETQRLEPDSPLWDPLLPHQSSQTQRIHWNSQWYIFPTCKINLNTSSLKICCNCKWVNAHKSLRMDFIYYNKFYIMVDFLLQVLPPYILGSPSCHEVIGFVGESSVRSIL